MNAVLDMELFRKINALSDVEKKAHDASIADFYEKEKKEAKEKAFFSCGLHGEHLMCSFDNFDCGFSAECNNARYAVSEFVYTLGKKLLFLLLGANGTGKTHLAAAALRIAGGLYRHSFNICAEYEDAHNFRSLINKAGVLKKYTEVSFLVIDEVGRATDQKTESVILSKILTERIECRKKTLVISNSSFEELCERYLDNAVADRLNVYGALVEMSGESYRLHQAKK